MSAQLSPQAERRLQQIIDIGERLFVLLLFATLVVQISRSLDLRPYNILLLISEGLIAFFVIIRRPARSITMRSFDWAIALICTSLPMLFRPGGSPPFANIVGTSLMFAGVLVAILAKLSLRRSFGIAAANRGAVIAGPYKIVRHPMYSGYIVTYLGFVLNNPLPWNIGIYGVTVALFVLRVRAEEAILKADPIYAAYSDRVRSRLIPAVF